MSLRLSTPGKYEKPQREDDRADLHEYQSIFGCACRMISFAHVSVDSVLTDAGDSCGSKETDGCPQSQLSPTALARDRIANDSPKPTYARGTVAAPNR